MRRVFLFATLLLAVPQVLAEASAQVVADREAFRGFYQARMPDIPLEAHKDGAYAIDAGKREQWLEMEEFPPYEFSLDDGADLFTTPFAGGGSYGDCFANDGAVKHLYPRFENGEVVTLEMAINRCRVAHDEEPLAWDSEELVLLAAHMAYVSRDETIQIDVPPSAMAAYEKGKQYYYSRRGQLNFACRNCHMQMFAQKLRSEVLSASLGHVTHWPTYRFKWQELGILHRRFQECNDQVGAEALPLMSETYRNLEFFLTVMSEGMPVNGPALRK